MQIQYVEEQVYGNKLSAIAPQLLSKLPLNCARKIDAVESEIRELLGRRT